jgi:cytochrome c556
MKSTSWWYWTLAVLPLVLLALASVVVAAPPAAPKVSTFAPAKDLASQVEAYIEQFDEAVKDEEEYKASEGKLLKDANTMILIALGLGLHDEENAYKAAAPGLIKAAQELAAAKDYAGAKTGVAAVKKAAQSKGDPSALKWEKVASLAQLMKAVPGIDSRLKRNTRTEKAFKSKSKTNAGDAAVLAVIAQGSIADTSEAKGDEQVQQWYKFCEQMRDAAAKVNAGVRAGDFAVVKAAKKDLEKSCHDCHEVFHKEALDKVEKEE